MNAQIRAGTAPTYSKSKQQYFVVLKDYAVWKKSCKNLD